MCKGRNFSRPAQNCRSNSNFKKGDRSKTTNYRPISILSRFNKNFEKLLYTRLYSYLIRYNLLSDQQFGFRKNSSTTPTLAVSKLYEELLTNIDHELYTCIVFFGFKQSIRYRKPRHPLRKT